MALQLLEQDRLRHRRRSGPPGQNRQPVSGHERDHPSLHPPAARHGHPRSQEREADVRQYRQVTALYWIMLESF